MAGARVQVVRDAAIDELPNLLRELQARRLFVISGPSRRHVNELRLEPEFSVDFFDEARRHVPKEVVEHASVRLEDSNADTVIALGGGSSTGLGKALRLTYDFRFVVIPTTYSGSEYTTLYGVTEQGQKQTGRDARVRPDLVLRDLGLTRDMPLNLTVTSLLNAMAHPLARLADENLQAKDAEQAQTAIKSLVQVLELLLVDPASSVGRRRAFAAAALAARAIEAGAFGRHHALVHLLGGAFDLDHAALHSVLLPHSVRALRLSREALMRRLARALDLPDLEAWLFDCLRRGGCPTSLGALGLELDQLQPVFERQSVEQRALLSDAFHGRRPARTT